jgi:hypothetical protein
VGALKHHGAVTEEARAVLESIATSRASAFHPKPTPAQVTKHQILTLAKDPKV